MNEVEVLQRDALTTALYAIHVAGPDDREAIATATWVVKAVAPTMSAASVEECAALAHQMAYLDPGKE